MLLYDNPISSNALKVRFLLAELDVPYDRRDVPLAQPRPGWYTAVNPLGGIPTLDDDGHVLSESNAILRYLANRERRDDLYPTDPARRSRVDVFLDRFSLSLRPALFRHEQDALGFVPGVGFDARPRDPEAAAVTAEAIAPTLRTFDRLVEDAGGSATGSPSLADFAAAPALFRTTNTGLDLSPYPALLAWRDAITARPSFAAAGPVL